MAMRMRRACVCGGGGGRRGSGVHGPTARADMRNLLPQGAWMWIWQGSECCDHCQTPVYAPAPAPLPALLLPHTRLLLLCPALRPPRPVPRRAGASCSCASGPRLVLPAGVWEYCGGETRLISVPRTNVFSELAAAIARAASLECPPDEVGGCRPMIP